ncbi:hypothetical protein [Agromyces sp. NPDC057865]|uniref:hypothetical protein n=1 Tax=Agromyces sp. NPDC057865 TaxID=3346267 RepID=UPI003672423F
MTETRPEPGIDPRFDPQYQRGYVPDAAAAEAGDQPPSIVIAPVDSPPPAPATPVRRSDPTARPRPMRAEPRDDFAVLERNPEEEEGDLFPPEFAEADDEPSPADPWFLAAWGVAVIAIVVGGAFWWAGLMADNPFSGVNQSDRWLQYVGWVVAPSLIQGGLLGLVAMFVWTGIRWARRHSEHS